MVESRVLVSPSLTCECVKWHRPKLRIADRHHIIPLSWDGPDILKNQVVICPNQHRLVHELLDLYKKRNGIVFDSDLRLFPRYTRKLAKEGWNGWVALHRGGIDE